MSETQKSPSVQQPTKDVVIKSYWWPEQTNIEPIELTHGYRKLISLNLNLSIFVIIPLSCLIIYLTRENLIALWQSFLDFVFWLNSESNSFLFYQLSFFVGLSTIVIWYIAKPKGVYLIDFTVWPGKKEWQISNDLFMRLSAETGYFTKDSLEFQNKMCQRTGVGDHTYLPPGIMSQPPVITMQKAREESEEILFSIIDQLFAQTKTKPSDIDILIVNCSLFCPTPSLAAMIINHYKMRSNVLAYNLGGMGCSAGVISIDLAKDLLQVHKNTTALVVSTENITQNWYRGNERGMMLQNALFRCGGAAMLLSNRWLDSWRAKYKLMTTVRVHKGASDMAYESVYQAEDDTPKLNKGVRLSKELMNVVGDALKTNMTELGPLVLPWDEQLKFLICLIYSKLCRSLGKKSAPYVPDFKKAFQHFCIHAGGRAIIDGLEQNLKLTERQVEPSRATLFRYGNTSSSSVWYELSYSEKMGYVKKGDKIWQIALGSGFKCNSAVWKSLKSSKPIAKPPPNNAV